MDIIFDLTNKEVVSNNLNFKPDNFKKCYKNENKNNISRLKYPTKIDIHIIEDITFKNDMKRTDESYFLKIFFYEDCEYIFNISNNNQLIKYGSLYDIYKYYEDNASPYDYYPIFYIVGNKNNIIKSGKIKINVEFSDIFEPFIFTLYSDNINLLKDNLEESVNNCGFSIYCHKFETKLKNDEEIKNYNKVKAWIEKPRLIYNILVKQPMYKYILFVDCDTMFYENNEKWMSFFEKLAKKNKDIIFQKDNIYPFNSGFQFIYNTPKTRELYNSVYNLMKKENFGFNIGDQDILMFKINELEINWETADEKEVGRISEYKDNDKTVLKNLLFNHLYACEQGGNDKKKEIINTLHNIKNYKDELNEVENKNIFDLI